MPLRRRPARTDRITDRRPAGADRRAGRSVTGPRLSRRPPEPPAVAGDRPDKRRPGRLTGRAAVLGLALCAVLLTLAYPMRAYLTQRHQIAALQQHQSAQRREIAALQARQQVWRDPAYVKAQARKRLQYVMPGEIGYVVLTGPTAPSAPAARPGTVVRPGATKRTAWYAELWSTVAAADSAR